ncbi:RDD family protein [Clostridium sp. LP20]|uniref:RDD family protein n=1 Tax=Clostridium sp. LP20 TaxID=3418665 RepID=UPI003EE659E0
MSKVLNVKKNKFPRIIAYIIDYLTIILSTSVISFYAINTELGINYIILNELPKEFRLMYDIIAISVSIVAIIVIPLFNKGRTIGKRIMHLDLISKDNNSISHFKIFIRQGLVIFLLGGILNPNHLYLIDFLNLSVNNFFGSIQMLINGLSIFCIFMFLFTKGGTTLYDKYLNLKVEANK